MRVARCFLLFVLVGLFGCSADSGATDTLEDTPDIAQQEVVDEVQTDVAEELDQTPDRESDLCVPFCEGMECGPDGCGGLCGECPGQSVCSAGSCCLPDCEDKACGADGCGGSCGECEFPGTCLNGQCCEPVCDGKDCGPDGCGGWCGVCVESDLCVDSTCMADGDGDGVPDEMDPFPTDSDLPGIAEPQMVYAHTDQSLFKMDVKMYKLDKVHDFVWSDDGGTHYVTDIGFDRFGVLYAVTFDNLYTCHPQNGICTLLGDLPEEFNGLTLIPKGYLDPFADTLVGISEEGGWYRLTVQEGQVTALKLGEYGYPYSSAGDAFSIIGVGTFAAVHKEGEAHDYLVAVNPSSGAILEEVGAIHGYTGIFGLAGWTGRAYAFDKNGDVVLVDTDNGQVNVLHETDNSWWGAGVTTLVN